MNPVDRKEKISVVLQSQGIAATEETIAEIVKIISESNPPMRYEEAVTVYKQRLASKPANANPFKSAEDAASEAVKRLMDDFRRMGFNVGDNILGQMFEVGAYEGAFSRLLNPQAAVKNSVEKGLVEGANEYVADSVKFSMQIQSSEAKKMDASVNVSMLPGSKEPKESNGKSPEVAKK